MRKKKGGKGQGGAPCRGPQDERVGIRAATDAAQRYGSAFRPALVGCDSRAEGEGQGRKTAAKVVARAKVAQAVDAAVLGSVDVEPLSDSYEQVDHATEGGDSLIGGDSLGVGWIATSTLVRKSDGGSAFRTCVGSVDAVLTRCRSGWADVDDAARRVEECAAAGALCVAVAADYRGRSDDDGEDDKKKGRRQE